MEDAITLGPPLILCNRLRYLTRRDLPGVRVESWYQQPLKQSRYYKMIMIIILITLEICNHTVLIQDAIRR
ncbi:hypothetical protein AM1_F0078 (plasmid) [Acaryochloris marina MBIC11017]|uniref:Uncharacterized protein n=1 Tax=Acaryochloris marina (strain MBIC 11017) TaxID=329726 RepID=A8ZQ59_ACAM1|nr:hypothetical protein AM1_F0078 [Acaryochloris marina MBIC11017]